MHLNIFISFILFIFSSSALANNSKIHQAMEQLGMTVESIDDSPLVSFKEVQTTDGLFYLTDDGKYLFYGQLYQAQGEKLVDLTAKSFAKQIETMTKQMITYPAKNEKYVVSVFTDISCGYCRELHHNIAQYNDAGITLRYLAFPREGLESSSFKVMSQVWCATDKNQALTDAKNDKYPRNDGLVCERWVTEQFNLGLKMGLAGTPAMILKDGTVLPGYYTSDELLTLLKEKD
ncbi:bifunctional protein-disulfide isomerase/oxidoreductase DsbC [Vibrio sp. SS-MA-C1-2]|uniref:bifunctional protein-disulfide isomerase/oxidoreductase DsbC n=1 Tax=Vibrio sp. SS-MA-C1-2 TaxID=2908646 RepID=UPI001F29643D|nr:bifunctional protein-disulfide isomerase/oxidoreductase DsbC [Vibrio sp. SS-MA-C1-2]UJF19671.1 bifunctional protein-disulfide isomerase/oxidoreductase DsbC [Vibrio sp. SS-MA-C1-2]